MDRMQSGAAAGRKTCPQCQGPLGHEMRGDLAVWECVQGHGVAVDIVEAFGHLQLDELQAIWAGAEGAPLSKLNSPVSGKPMVQVTFVADDDEADGNVGLNAQNVTIELDIENHLAWFSLQEIVDMPKTGSRRAPGGIVSLGELDKEEDTFGEIFDDAENYRGSDEPESGLNGFLGGLSRRLRS